MNVYPIRCRITGSAETTRVDIFDDIGEGGWFDDGITAKSFAAELAKATGPLDVHINSYGGDVADGLAILNGIRGYQGAKRTVVDGFACSIASVIAQAGDERVMQPGSMMMIHDALTYVVGNAAEMRDAAQTLDKHSDNIAQIYADRAGGTVAQWRETMAADTWFTAAEAVDAGLADRVGDGQAQLPQGLDVAALGAPSRIAAQLRRLQAGGRPDRDDAELAAIHAALHFRNADVDESAWDGGAAMSGAANSDDPAAAYRAICAGRKAGDPDKQSSWALPHHKHAGDAPNADGVRNALSRLPQTDGLENEAAAKAHLEAHMSAISPDGGDSNSSNQADFGWFADALKGASR